MTSMDKPIYALEGKRIFIAGHTGMVGSALMRRFAQENCEIITASHSTLDLTRQSPTESYITDVKPDVIIVAAARVGGILANAQYPADFLYDNLAIGMNVIHAAHLCNVERLLWLGSSCIYPRDAVQPLQESALLTAPLEPTNEAYAIAKIAALKYAQACSKQYGSHFMTAMPTNLYGPNDNFDLNSSHVLPALMRRIHEAKTSGADRVIVWGSGNPLREFLHVDDLADACLYLLCHYHQADPINIGSGEEVSITELALMLADIIGFRGKIENDLSKPDGTPRKLLDTSHMKALGWSPRIRLQQGLAEVYYNWSRQFATSEAAA